MLRTTCLIDSNMWELYLDEPTALNLLRELVILLGSHTLCKSVLKHSILESRLIHSRYYVGTQLCHCCRLHSVCILNSSCFGEWRRCSRVVRHQADRRTFQSPRGSSRHTTKLGHPNWIRTFALLLPIMFHSLLQPYSRIQYLAVRLRNCQRTSARYSTSFPNTTNKNISNSALNILSNGRRIPNGGLRLGGWKGVEQVLSTPVRSTARVPGRRGRGMSIPPLWRR